MVNTVLALAGAFGFFWIGFLMGWVRGLDWHLGNLSLGEDSVPEKRKLAALKARVKRKKIRHMAKRELEQWKAENKEW